MGKELVQTILVQNGCIVFVSPFDGLGFESQYSWRFFQLVNISNVDTRTLA